MDYVEDFKTIGSLSWKLLKSINQSRKETEQEGLKCRYDGLGIGTNVKRSCSAMPEAVVTERTSGQLE